MSCEEDDCQTPARVKILEAPDLVRNFCRSDAMERLRDLESA